MHDIPNSEIKFLKQKNRMEKNPKRKEWRMFVKETVERALETAV